MDSPLSQLIYKDLQSTRDRMRDAALVLGSLQRAFLPPNEHDWQHGLEVGMRGPKTQNFTAQGKQMHASLDLVRQKVRLSDTNWPLRDMTGPTLLRHIEQWLEDQQIAVELEQPEFSKASQLYDADQARDYAEALWWFEERFRELRASIKTGLTSPIFLYPHHFDLSLSWFPHNDKRQCNIGFSTGDETIQEPYVYITAYPEPAGYTDDLPLLAPAFWQQTGFTGAILHYQDFVASDDPKALFRAFAGTFQTSAALLD